MYRPHTFPVGSILYHCTKWQNQHYHLPYLIYQIFWHRLTSALRKRLATARRRGHSAARQSTLPRRLSWIKDMTYPQITGLWEFWCLNCSLGGKCQATQSIYLTLLLFCYLYFSRTDCPYMTKKKKEIGTQYLVIIFELLGTSLNSKHSHSNFGHT